MICKLFSRLTGREARRLRARLCALVVEHNARLGELKQRHEAEVHELHRELGRAQQSACAYRAEAAVLRELAEKKGAVMPQRES